MKKFALCLPLLLCLALLCAGRAVVGAQPPSPSFARWEKTIAAFEKQDRSQPPPEGAILFVGSSSIRLWNLARSFPDLKTINRGFGGSQIADVVHFTPRIVLKYRPRIIVFYAGDNDIAVGKTPQQVFSDFQAFVQLVQKALPGTQIIFLPIKPSLRRWSMAQTQQQANTLIENYCRKQDRLTYVDVVHPMLGKEGRPRPELFARDGLHLNEAGYQLWTKLLRPHLTKK